MNVNWNNLMTQENCGIFVVQSFNSWSFILPTPEKFLETRLIMLREELTLKNKKIKELKQKLTQTKNIHQEKMFEFQRIDRKLAFIDGRFKKVSVKKEPKTRDRKSQKPQENNIKKMINSLTETNRQQIINELLKGVSK